MDEDYLYENEKYVCIVDLLKKINRSLTYTAPEAMENKYYLLAEKYAGYFYFEEDDEEPKNNRMIKRIQVIDSGELDVVNELMNDGWHILSINDLVHEIDRTVVSVYHMTKVEEEK